MNFVSDLNAKLLRLSPYEFFYLRDACAGVHAFGQIGSGKTSGLLQMLLGAYLRAGMGGVITAAKPDAVEDAIRAAALHGRSNSVIIFDENEGFNFLAHEMARQGLDGIGSVTECLMHVVEASKKANPHRVTARGGRVLARQWSASHAPHYPAALCRQRLAVRRGDCALHQLCPAKR